MEGVNSYPLLFYVNGKEIVELNAEPETTLLSYLRNTLRLTGSKLGCGEGGCGACTVMVSKWNNETKALSNFAVNACLAPVVSVHGCAVTTVEGIGSTKTKLHEVQKRLAMFHGSQCGFCTPGIVMSMYALLRNKQSLTSRDICGCLQGNLCRCTGYRSIVAAFNTFCENTCAMAENCCMVNAHDINETSDNEMSMERYDSSQEPIFPPQLLLQSKNDEFSKSIRFVGERVSWYVPSTLDEIVALKVKFPNAPIVIGNTEVGIETKIKGLFYPVVISPRAIPELYMLKIESDGVCIGAACSLSDVDHFMRKLCENDSRHNTQVFRCIVEMLELFAGTQIRNVACIGGNIMTASPISDLNPILLACGAKLTFISDKNGYRDVIMDRDFFTGYRKTATDETEILLNLKIPFLEKNDIMVAYKQSKRKEDDIAIVNTAMLVKIKPQSDIVESFSAAFGGMAAVTKVPAITMENMKRRSWDDKLLEDCCNWLTQEMTLSEDAPGGMVEYRRTLVTSFFFKFYMTVGRALLDRNWIKNEVFLEENKGASNKADFQDIRCTQTWHEVPKDQRKDDTVGRPVMHVSAYKHVTGEAQYIDDLLPIEGELHLALVTSSKAHAKIIEVDFDQALKSPGVVSYIDKTDIPGENYIDNELTLADDEVTCIGQVIGGVIADTEDHAVIASRLVNVKYEILQEVITIEDAIENESYHEEIKLISGDDSERAFAQCDHVLNGEFRMSGQEHFYMEPQSCIAIPKKEDGEMEILCSCQSPTDLQDLASECLGVTSNKVTVRVKRMGGGFGGKDTRFRLNALPAVIAAKKTGRPIRCVLRRQLDMEITGGRHPVLSNYKIGFSKDGRIKAVKGNVYVNAGNTEDRSVSVMKKVLLAGDNCCKIPSYDVTGYVCRTNLPSNTAFRGFGNPQGMLIAEDRISKIAAFLCKTPEEIREKNMYNDNDTTHYGQNVGKFQARRCWFECIDRANFDQRKLNIEEFNRIHKWKKRGIACVPTKFGVACEIPFLNQAGALVHIYKDGSVLLSHGGTEMGQGLWTKMIQVASRELGIDMSLIHTSEITTQTVPNTSPTVASVNSDLNGMAIKIACEKLIARLDRIRKENPTLPWQKLIEKAYLSRVSLSATGHYGTPNLNLEWNYKTGKTTGNARNYYSYGAAVSEVEIDVLTGHHVPLRTDIVMDVGNSINPAIDIGQIEGAFAQGYGLMTLEEPLYSTYGKMWTVGPGAYKIPGFTDLPKQFNVHLLRSSPNEKAIYSSKAVGEPPLFLASSIFFAIKAAIEAARKQSGITGWFRLDSPASAERIRMACQDKFTEKAKVNPDEKNGLKPWAIRV